MKLMLPSDHNAFLTVGTPSHFSKYKPILFVFGVLIVLLGALDLSRRIPDLGISDETLRTAFAPGVTLNQ